jgi:hypothetical protein
MLKIEWVEDWMRGEPGPTLYWSGNPGDFLDAAVALHGLGESNDVALAVSELAHVQVEGKLSVVAHSLQNGKTLVKNEAGKICIELDCEVWRQIIHQLLSLSFVPSFDYVEFHGQGMMEEANFIIDSTGPV